MRFLKLTTLAIGLLGTGSTCVQAQGYWFDGGCYSLHAAYVDPFVVVEESWPAEAYYPPIAPQPWYGSMTAAQQLRMLSERRSADAPRERKDSSRRPKSGAPLRSL